jgi:hypothetical protein
MDGLKSINKRLEELQQELKKLKHIEFEEPEDNLLKSSESKKKQETNRRVKRLKEHYMKDVFEFLKGDFHENKITEIVLTTVRWIELNIIAFSDILNTPITSSLKLETAISLILELVNSFDKQFLENSINVLVSLLYPKPLPNLSRRKSILTINKHGRTKK